MVAGWVTSGSDANTNATFDFQEVDITPSISTQPLDATACSGCNTSFSVGATNTDTYQWQLFNGSVWVDLADTGIYSGTTTNTLSITNVTMGEDNNQYWAIASNSNYICASVTSDVAILTIMVNMVITNRRITIRVNRN